MLAEQTGKNVLAFKDDLGSIDQLKGVTIDARVDYPSGGGTVAARQMADSILQGRLPNVRSLERTLPSQLPRKRHIPAYFRNFKR